MPEADAKQRQRGLICASVCGLLTVALLLLLVLLPLSFVSLEYYEIGFKRSRTRGTVYIEKVYGPGGRYFVSPDLIMQKYQADAHVFEVSSLSVVTKDKLEARLAVTVIYFINPETLPALQKEYNLNYHSAVENNAIAVIKNTAVNFTTLQYFSNRTLVQGAMHSALKELTPTLFVSFPFFYLGGMTISETVAAKQLQTSVQNEINAMQLFENQAAEVRRKTDTKVNDLINSAALTRQQAIAAAAAGVRVAQAEARKMVDEARISSAATVFKALSLNSESDKQKLDWMLGMLKREDLKIRLGYQPQLVTAAK